MGKIWRRGRLRALIATALMAAVIGAPATAVAAGSLPGGSGQGATTGDVRVYLAGRDPAGLAGYGRLVSTPGSPGYRHYLTPAQLDRRFGPTEAQVRAVTGWLAGAGLTVTAVTRHYVAVSGSAAAMQAAFGATPGSRMVSGAQRASRPAVTVPAGIASAVLTVTGLSTTTARPAADVTSGRASQRTCSRYWGQETATTLPPAYGHVLPYAPCGYVPAQLQAAYQVTGTGLTGKGQTVAIVDSGASPSIAADVNRFASRHDGQPLRPGQLTQYLPAGIAKSCAAQGSSPNGYAEETTDVEAVHAIAPDAGIAYVGVNCDTGITAGTDLLDAETRIVDGHLASIVSNSWRLGLEAQLPPGATAAFQQVFERGAAEGIGFYFSSGDHSDFGATAPGHQPAVEYPASDPWVTAVGGTSLAVGSGHRYLWETGWGTLSAPLAADGASWTGLPGTSRGGAGGGRSVLFTQPAYQRGIVPAALSQPAGTAGPARVIPDIAAVADPNTGMLMGITTPQAQGGPARYVEEITGGTSLSAPLIAGIQADAQQAAGGIPIGFANPALYARYGTASYRDITDQPGVGVGAVATSNDPATGAVSYEAIAFGHDNTLHATPGYDDVTGVGTPTGRYLDSYRPASRVAGARRVRAR